MGNKLIDYISQELEKRDWSMRKLARESGISQTQISNVLAEQRSITFEFCKAIARAFGDPPDKLFRLAELIQEPEQSPGETDLVHNYRRLSKSQQKFLLDMLRGLLGAPPASQPQLTDSRVEYNAAETAIDRVKRLQSELAEAMGQLSVDEIKKLDSPQLTEAVKALLTLNPQQMNVLREVTQQTGRRKPTGPKQ